MNQNEQARFDELLSLLLDGQIDEAQWKEFQDYIAEDERARRQYRQTMMVESLLERFQADGIVQDALSASDDSPSLAVRLVIRTRDFFVRPTPLSMAVAAVVIGLLVTAMAFMAPPFYRVISGLGSDDEPTGESQTFVAQLTGTHEAVWADGQLTPSRGAHLQVGRRMELVSGVAEVTYRPGATVTIEGPAEWIVVEEGRMRLNYGSIVARVNPEAIGFAVVTPLAEITDLGTEFGVVAERTGATSTFVFRGSVELQPTSAGDSKPRVLKAGEGMRINGGGTIKELSEPMHLEHPCVIGPAWLEALPRIFAQVPHRLCARSCPQHMQQSSCASKLTTCASRQQPCADTFGCLCIVLLSAVCSDVDSSRLSGRSQQLGHGQGCDRSGRDISAWRRRRCGAVQALALQQACLQAFSAGSERHSALTRSQLQGRIVWFQSPCCSLC